MSVFGAVDFDQHEQVFFVYDHETSLKAIIAIHNTNRGPSIGGCRMWPYPNEQLAVTDALRLARGMTYKSAMANLPFGGGKAVIIGDPRKDKSPSLLRAFGRCVEKLNGRYITGEDVGTTVEDIAFIRETTSHVVGLPGGSGDPSLFAARGVYKAIQAAVLYQLAKPSLKGITVAVQGLGHVGYSLCKLLSEAEAQLIITDVEQELVQRGVKEFKAQAVSPESIYSVDAEVFSPCALGAIINDITLPQLKCVIIAGSANNQLHYSVHGDLLAERKILYAPDYVINAGGLINVSYEGPNYNVEKVKCHVERIPDTLFDIFHKAEKLHISTSRAADLIAEHRFRHG